MLCAAIRNSPPSEYWQVFGTMILVALKLRVTNLLSKRQHGGSYFSPTFQRGGMCPSAHPPVLDHIYRGSSSVRIDAGSFNRPEGRCDIMALF